ncbi:MAG: DUF4274 domain-containing protein [Roseomonas mucosa]|nr:DUF4274 domain-containing protein [Roseomonas mucosa]
MIEPAFSNAVRRAIAGVADGFSPASVLDDPVALHQVAMGWNGDTAEPDDLLALAGHPRLARGTLLMLYWRSAPTYYRRYAREAEVPDTEWKGYEICRSLAAIYLNRSDLCEGIAFDPRNDDGFDWTTAYDDVPWPGRIRSRRLLDAVPGEAVAWPTGPDRLTRRPDAAEQVVIDARIARGRALLPGLPADAPPDVVAWAVADALRQAGRAAPHDLAWPWLDALGWSWRCGGSATDGVLFGVVRETLSCFVPDIVYRTAEAGIDPGETYAFFDLARRLPPGPLPHAFWDEARAAFTYGWIVPE